MFLVNFNLNNVTKKVVFLVFFTVVSQGLAQFDVTKYTINNGGTKSSGENFVVTASIGQLDAVSNLSAEGFLLRGGFWQQKEDLIFKNDFEQL